VPDQISENINKKEYLTAARLIVEARENLAGPLSNVDALKEVKSDLETREEVCFNEGHAKCKDHFKKLFLV